MSFDQLVKNVYVYRTIDLSGRYSILVKWDAIVPNVPDVTGFNIYRTVLDDDVKINKSVVTQNFYLDENAPVYPGQDWYYRVTVISASSGESDYLTATKVNIYTHGGEGLMGRIESVAREEIRRLAIGFNMQGETLTIFVKRVYGPTCPVCYNELSGRGADPNCKTCYGTGIEGGYDVYQTKGVVYETSKRIMESREGLRERYVPRGVIASYPILHDGDGLRRTDGKAYILSEVSPQLIQNFLIEQQFTLAQIPEGHVLYRISGS